MSSKGQFQKKCHLVWHEESDLDLQLRDLTQRRYVPAILHDYIIENKLLTDNKPSRHVTICTSCIAKVKQHVQEPAKKIKTGIPIPVVDAAMCSMSLVADQDKIGEAVSVISSAILKNELTCTQRKTLVDAIAMVASNELHAVGSRDTTHRLQDIFCSSYVDTWGKLDNGFLKDFLESLSKTHKTDSTECRKLVKSFESLHWLADSKFLSNTALGEAVLLQQFCQSKYGVELLSRIQPSGSYSTIRRVMNNLNRCEKSIPSNDIIFAFDNNQVVKRTWMVKYMGKQPTSTVTAMVFFDMGSSSQNQFTLAVPTALFPTPENQNLLTKKYKQFAADSDATHRLYRKRLIQSIIETVKQDCKKVGTDIVDSISSDNLQNAGYAADFDYKRVAQTQRLFPINDLDCMDVNPNSYATLHTILEKILTYIDKTERKFIPVVMDGSPFSMCQNIIRESYVCSVCQNTIPSANMESHAALHENDVASFRRKYKKIIIRPGNGHVEMTAVKSILSFFWDPFIKPIAKLMGYTTENSLQYAKKGCDHHKSYNLLMIIFESMAHELIYAFVKTSLLNDQTINYEKFCEWEKKVSGKNTTFQIAMDFVFTTLHSLHLFRSAVRNCNDPVALAARDKLSSIFYILNNTKYQEIICYDTLYLLSLSTVGQRAIGIESSFGLNGTLGEGFDFLLENRNKMYKSFLATEVCPTFDHWLTVSRTASDLIQLRNNAAARLELNIRTGETRQLRLGNEVFQARKYIRKLNVLTDRELPFMSFDENPVRLDNDAIVYVSTSRKNQFKYYESYAGNQKILTTILSITTEDFIDSNTKLDSIKKAVEQKVASLQEPFHTLYKDAIKKASTSRELLHILKAAKLQIQSQIEKELDHDMVTELFDDMHDDDDGSN